MYYVLASFVVGAFVGGSALITSHPASTNADQNFSQTYAETFSLSSDPIVDNVALSADAVILN